MRQDRANRERGVALLAFVAVVGLVASWFLVKQLNLESGGLDAARKDRNAEVLSRAKLALIGYIAAQAAKPGEDRPGALPCPEAPGNFDSAANEGTVSYPCTPPTVGRFPWKTLGLDKLVDASGEPLWYVVAPGWAGANTVINSNCATYNIAGFACSTGRLTVDGVTDDVIALIIAPGPAFVVAISGGNCAAKSQARPTTGNPDWSNYLECENATYPTADATFATTGPTGSFNDQVVKITATELMPAVEAAIADRIEREISPALRSMYSGGHWTGSSSTPALPFAAPFANPATSSMQGVAGTLRGLLPLVYSETTPGGGTTCTEDVTAPRCNPTLTTWSTPTMAGGSTYSESCSIASGTITCSFNYQCALLGCAATTASFTVSETASNIGMAMRQLTATQATVNAAFMSNVQASGRTLSATLNANGSATVSVGGTVIVSGAGPLLGSASCGLFWPLTIILGCKQSTLSMPANLFQVADHSILDATTTGAGATGWFLRNKWHEVSYYAVASGFAPSGAKSCITSSTCLTVNYHRNSSNVSDAGKQRAVILLSGRSLTGAARPNGTLSDWFEGANADGTSPFETRSATLAINRTFNDRVAVISANP